MKILGHCMVTSVWGLKLVCVQESGLFTYIVHYTQIDTTENLAGAIIIPAITRFVDLSG